MLSDLSEIRTFVQIVVAGSLSAAARDMGVALSVVSKRLATLERRVETNLILRSTRHLALTDDGRRFFDRAQRILAEVDEAETALTHGRVEPQGVLRISATNAFGRAHVSPVCQALVRAHPKLSVELMLTDRVVELIDERLDLVIRIGEPRDSDLIMRKLIDNHRILVAAPDYIARCGAPATPETLVDHECLLYPRNGQSVWRLVDRGGRPVEVRVSSRLRSDSGEVAHDWALAGCGLIMKSWVDVAADLATGKLVRVLPDWRSDPAPVCALFAQNRQVPTRVRLFLDSLTGRLASLASVAKQT